MALGTNMVPSGHGKPHDPLLQQDPQMSTQTLAAMGLLAAAWAWMTTWLEWQYRSPQSVWLWQCHGAGTPTWTRVAVQTLGIPVAMYIHLHRPWLW